VAAIESTTDAEVLEFVAMQPQELQARHEGQTPEQIRAGMLATVRSQTVTGLPPDQDETCLEQLCYLCGCGAYDAADWWKHNRQLELPQAVADAAGVASTRHLADAVNPTAWPRAKPYISRGGFGGMEAPWVLLLSMRELEAFDKADCNFKSVPEALQCLFGRAAAAMRRLTAGDELELTLDAGDVVSLPRRMRSLAEGECRIEPLRDEFDRIHLSNIPDYVRIPYLAVVRASWPCLSDECSLACVASAASALHKRMPIVPPAAQQSESPICCCSCRLACCQC
jgi:hypothetical protein